MRADIRRIVRQGAQGEGEFVKVGRLEDEIDDKISAAHVMSQIAEKFAAERVISDVLNQAAAIGVSMGLAQFLRRGGWEMRQENRLYLILPGDIHKLLMR